MRPMKDDASKPVTSLQQLVERGADVRQKPWTPSPKLMEALQEREEAEDLPDPPAPDPVVLLPEDGGRVLVAEIEAAEAYVPPTDVKVTPGPRMPTGPVKIRSDVDPRRQKTQPVVRVAPSVSQPPLCSADAMDSSPTLLDAVPVALDSSPAAIDTSPLLAGLDTSPLLAGLDASPSRVPFDSSRPPATSVSTTAPRSRRDDAHPRRPWAAAVLVAAVAASLALVVARTVVKPAGAGDGSNAAGLPSASIVAGPGSAAVEATSMGGMSGFSAVPSASVDPPAAMTSTAPLGTGVPAGTAHAFPAATGAPSAPSAPPSNAVPAASANPRATSAPSAHPKAAPSASPSAAATAPPVPLPPPGSDIW
jgi:hypothetical protein